MLEIKKPLVSVYWLQNNLHAKNLIVLNASIKKVTDIGSSISEEQIPLSRFFDLKHKFSDTTGQFSYTCPSEVQFTQESQKLGINSDSVIVIYDDKGIYSSPRAWWLFKAYGHNNVAVLNGGLPEWKKAGYPLKVKQENLVIKGNFQANYNEKSVYFFDDIKTSPNNQGCNILDARSENRFKGLLPEPRKGLRSGTILNSKNLPFELLINNGKMKSKKDLKTIFSKFGNKDSQFVFSCGSGITACVSALRATILGYNNLTVYDGSWTEYGSLTQK